MARNTPPSDEDWMRSATAEAAKGLGRTWPNPSVGCALVADQRLIARTHTAPGGRPHAETQALEIAGTKAQGASAYVTLEPCAHHGKTPPCADALISARVARVVIGMRDPDPRVAGKGIERMRAAGIEVVSGVNETAIQQQLSGYLCRTTEGRPFVTLKLAFTIDGRIATAARESRWITGPAARRRVHTLRSRADAVLVGRGTAIDDDPGLDVRGMGKVPQPIRIVADTSLALLPESRLAISANTHPVWILHGQQASDAKADALRRSGVNLVATPICDGAGLDLRAALSELGRRGLTNILCEGGAGLAASLLAEGLVDRIISFHAGLFLGADAVSGVGGLVMSALADAERFKLEKVEAIGPDTMSVWTR